MIVGELFAGIGGFGMGFERAGHKVAWQVEIDPKCRKLLACMFPDAKRYADVRKVGRRELSPVDVLLAGFPCQDVSVAGAKLGLAGKRTSLFYQFVRIANELKPAFLIWENVPGLLSSHQGRDFAKVLLSLGRIGYHGAWRTFDAQYFGLAQRRRRLFGVFARGDIGAESCGEILSLSEGMRWHPAPKRRKGQKVAPCLTTSAGRRCGPDEAGSFIITDTKGEPVESALIAFSGRERGDDGRGYDRAPQVFGEDTVGALDTVKPHCIAFSTKYGDVSEEIAPTLRASNGEKVNGGGTTALQVGSQVRKMTPLECERAQGFPDNYTAAFADSVRYKMLGNAVPPPIANWIAKRMPIHVDQSPQPSNESK